MNRHFTTFTAGGMGALREAMMNGHASRHANLNALREDLRAHLDAAHKRRRHEEDERRYRAAHDNSSRQMFMDDLRANVHALGASTRAMCGEMAADRLALAAELAAAQQAFRGEHAPTRNQGSKR